MNKRSLKACCGILFLFQSVISFALPVNSERKVEVRQSSVPAKGLKNRALPPFRNKDNALCGKKIAINKKCAKIKNTIYTYADRSGRTIVSDLPPASMSNGHLKLKHVGVGHTRLAITRAFNSKTSRPRASR